MVQIISGIGSFESFRKLKNQYSGKNILLVTGKDSYKLSGAKKILDQSLDGEKVLRFFDFDVNPKIEDAQRGTSLARDAGIDLIIAVGGGSVIDMAKLIKAFYLKPKLSQELAQGKVAMSDPNIPLIVAPTTAGSGSEATHFAVIYIGSVKYSLASQSLLPETVILDGKLIATCSAYQKACNGLDALAQASESAWAAGSTDVSRANSFNALNLCINYLKNVVKNDADDIALQGILEAANLAGQAINISKTTAAHAWSYGITNSYGVPHGHAVWLTLPTIFQINALCTDDKVTHLLGADHLKGVMKRLMKTLSIPVPTQAGHVLRNYMSSIGIESDLVKMGADTVEKRKFLSEQVNMERMSNNPSKLDGSDITEIFKI